MLTERYTKLHSHFYPAQDLSEILEKTIQHSYCRYMDTSNFTKDGELETFPDIYCAAVLTGEMRKEWTLLAVLNIILSVAAFLGNTLILVALHKESSLHPPSKLLLRCLTTTDLCVGLISEPVSVITLMSIPGQRWNMCHYAVTSSVLASYIFCSVSLLTLTAISVDRLLALLLRLRYRQVVTLRRTYVTAIIFWVVSIISAAMSFWNYHITAWYGYIVTVLCLITSTVSYTKIALTLRHHQTQVQGHFNQDQPNQATPLNIAQYKKAVSSALMLQLTLVACYLPFGIVDSVRTQNNHSSTLFLVREFTLVLVYLNSSLNPILYCWRIKEVRQAVKDTIRQLKCWSS